MIMRSLPLILHLPNGRQQTVKLPAISTIRRLIPALISKLTLPTHDDNGNMLVYHLHLDPDEAALAGDMMLKNAGIPPHTHLHLIVTPTLPPPLNQAPNAPFIRP